MPQIFRKEIAEKSEKHTCQTKETIKLRKTDAITRFGKYSKLIVMKNSNTGKEKSRL